MIQPMALEVANETIFGSHCYKVRCFGIGRIWADPQFVSQLTETPEFYK